MTTTTWDELYRGGAIRFYEGDDPDGFAAEMLAEFGLDVRKRIDWIPAASAHEGDAYGWDIEIDGEPMLAFWIPGGLDETIYGSDRWPLGS
jgi:hypothetical protein